MRYNVFYTLSLLLVGSPACNSSCLIMGLVFDCETVMSADESELACAAEQCILVKAKRVTYSQLRCTLFRMKYIIEKWKKRREGNRILFIIPRLCDVKWSTSLLLLVCAAWMKRCAPVNYNISVRKFCSIQQRAFFNGQFLKMNW